MSVRGLVQNGILLLCSIVAAGCGGSTSTGPPPVLSAKFSDIQRRLLDGSCAYSGCHGGPSPQALLSLEAGKSYNNLLHRPIQNSVGVTLYKALVVAGKPDSSFLYIKITNPSVMGEGDRMPQRLDKLPQNEIDAIKTWIANGALDD